jgi:amidohydrolase
MVSSSFVLHAQKQITAEDKIVQKVTEWRRDFHKNPELGNREFRTAEIVAKHLESLGITVTKNVGKTGVVGILRGALSGPVIALRADMDALPVEEKLDLSFASTIKTTYNNTEVKVMHACGHDAHTAILMGVAEILSKQKQTVKGTIKFIFQPAEEGAPIGEKGGAKLMVEEGVMDNPKVDVIFGLHVQADLQVGQIGYKPAGAMASASDMKITVTGTGAHGASPWMGVDPIVTAAQIVTNLQTIVSRNVKVTDNAAVVTIGSIHGGNRFNIIPDAVEMTGTVRALTDEDEKLIFENIKRIATKTAEANNAKAIVELPLTVHYPVTFNDVVLTQRMLPALQKTVGEANTILQTAKTGSEDFSFYQQKAPGLFFFLGAKPINKNATSHHTSTFFVDEACLPVGINAFLNLINAYNQNK